MKSIPFILLGIVFLIQAILQGMAYYITVATNKSDPSYVALRSSGSAQYISPDIAILPSTPGEDRSILWYKKTDNGEPPEFIWITEKEWKQIVLKEVEKWANQN